jgi:hypothetical protein
MHHHRNSFADKTLMGGPVTRLIELTNPEGTKSRAAVSEFSACFLLDSGGRESMRTGARRKP